MPTLTFFCFLSLWGFLLNCDSKSGRPLKKLSDRKVFSRLGHVANGGSPDFNGIHLNIIYYQNYFPTF